MNSKETIKRCDVHADEVNPCPYEIDERYGPYVRIKDLVKYLHEQIHISDTNRKAYDEECKSLDSTTKEWKWKMIESVKSEAEMNAFILVLQALGENPIKETK